MDVIGGLRLKVGPDEATDWIEVFPKVNIEDLSDRDRLITIKGVFRLQGSGPETYVLTRLV